MTAEEKVARRKLSLPELAVEMNNVSKACRVMGYSRPQPQRRPRSDHRIRHWDGHGHGSLGRIAVADLGRGRCSLPLLAVHGRRPGR